MTRRPGSAGGGSPGRGVAAALLPLPAATGRQRTGCGSGAVLWRCHRGGGTCCCCSAAAGGRPLGGGSRSAARCNDSWATARLLLLLFLDEVAELGLGIGRALVYAASARRWSAWPSICSALAAGRFAGVVEGLLLGLELLDGFLELVVRGGTDWYPKLNY